MNQRLIIKGVAPLAGAWIETLQIEKDAAAGIVLSTGEELRAARIVSNADPQRTAKMVEMAFGKAVACENAAIAAGE